MSEPRCQAELIERTAHMACLLEATARKAGNVHPAAAFEHLNYGDFVRSAQAIAPVLARVETLGVGGCIRDAVIATRQCCTHNTNLGIILLLAPLAAVPPEKSVPRGIGAVLSSLTRDDARQVYEAIRIAAPRGLGNTDSQDVSNSEPAGTLTDVMRLAADRDSIAAQYATSFELVLTCGVPALIGRHSTSQSVAMRHVGESGPTNSAECLPGTATHDWPRDWERAVLTSQLALMAAQPDTDIARKCGGDTARESARRANDVLQSGWPESPSGRQRFAEFDAWLRADRSQRNPGTTADLITASLFIALRDRLIEPPSIPSLQQHAATLMYTSRGHQ